MKKILTWLLVALLGATTLAPAQILPGILAAPTTSGGFTCTTYATFDGANTGSALTLSGGSLTATNSNSGVLGNTRSTIGKSSGKWYWEYLIGANSQERIGIVNSTFAITTSALLGSTNSWAYKASDGTKLLNGAGGVAYGASWTTGDYIGYALDMDGGTLTMYKNNASQGVMVSGLSGTLYAAAGENILNAALTANFGATALHYSPPAGFTAGLCN